MMLVASSLRPVTGLPRLYLKSGALIRRSSSPITITITRRSYSLSSSQLSQDAYFLTDSRPIILFDGVCNLCNGGVNMVLDNDPNETLRFAALQSDAGRALLQRSGRSPNDISSIVLVEKNRSYIKSEAVLRIANYLRVPFPLIAAILDPCPLFLRDIVYDTVATNRYIIFGQTNVCRLTDTTFMHRFIEQ
eukprot:c20556_g1_i3 orf=313-885(-)